MPLELGHLNASVPDDLAKKPGADVLAGVDGNDGCPAIRVAHEDVAAPLPHRLKAERLEGPEDLPRRQGS